MILTRLKEWHPDRLLLFIDPISIAGLVTAGSALFGGAAEAGAGAAALGAGAAGAAGGAAGAGLGLGGLGATAAGVAGGLGAGLAAESLLNKNASATGTAPNPTLPPPTVVQPVNQPAGRRPVAQSNTPTFLGANPIPPTQSGQKSLLGQ
jgi:hypothetical protein